MTERTTAALGALGLLAALVLVAVVVPVPYVTYVLGPTVDVLGETEGEEIIQVDGADAYYDDGEIRLTTIRVTQPDDSVNLFTALAAWINRDEALYPYDLVYPEPTTREEEREEGQIQMSSSQDNAVAAALRELGYDVPPRLSVAGVTPDAPADGALAVGDLLLAVNGIELAQDAQPLLEQIRGAEDGETVELTVLRNGAEQTVEVGTQVVTVEDGSTRRTIGIDLGFAFEEFPVKVSFGIENIGGPSAGLIFALAVYDTLTPGSLTGGRDIAGTGELGPDGTVGAIGGIQQKIAAARIQGVELFLVPADNCADALGARAGDVQLVRAETMPQALKAVQDWVADPAADLPSCDDAA
jgi:PDZ domain-containing protein